MENYDPFANDLLTLSPPTPQPQNARPRSQPPRSNPPINTPINPSDNFFAFLDTYTFSENIEARIALAQASASKRRPKLSGPSTSYSKCLSLVRRHLVTIFISRGPVYDDEMMNPIMIEVFKGPMTLGVWRLVYELADLEQGIGDVTEKGRLKVSLARELVRCVSWDEWMDKSMEATRLVDDIFL